MSTEPARTCALCPRLADFRNDNISRFPDWHNAPVPTWYPDGRPSKTTGVRLLVVGLAPGLRGANRTGRPFTGDYAGDLLYATLHRFGFAEGDYQARSDDSLNLKNTAITNAVRCVPPKNKPVGAEINSCRPFLKQTIAHLEDLRVILTLGKIAHDSTLRALDTRLADAPFAHNAVHQIDGLHVVSSYHCSRYNTNTGRLTPKMFDDVFGSIRQLIG